MCQWMGVRDPCLCPGQGNTCIENLHVAEHIYIHFTFSGFVLVKKIVTGTKQQALMLRGISRKLIIDIFLSPLLLGKVDSKPNTLKRSQFFCVQTCSVSAMGRNKSTHLTRGNQNLE